MNPTSSMGGGTTIVMDTTTIKVVALIETWDTEISINLKDLMVEVDMEEAVVVVIMRIEDMVHLLLLGLAEAVEVAHHHGQHVVVAAVDEEVIVVTTTCTLNIEDKTITTAAGTGDETVVTGMFGASY